MTDLERLRALQDEAARKARLKYLFFWSHKEGSRSAGRACLSQWYPAPFVLDGARYPTAEHWLMAEKARLFGDAHARDRVLAARSPGAAKRIGREVRRFDEAVWGRERFGVAVRGNVAKFGQNPELGRFLVGTRRRVLVEASPRDRVWGIGLAEDDDRATTPSLWRGLNVLGFSLMEARSRLP